MKLPERARFTLLGLLHDPLPDTMPMCMHTRIQNKQAPLMTMHTAMATNVPPAVLYDLCILLPQPLSCLADGLLSAATHPVR